MEAEACLQALEEVTARWPRYPDSWYNYGLLLAHLERYPEALSAMEKALELHPQYLEAGIARCFLLGDLGRQSEGLQAFRRLHVRSPDDFQTVFALGAYAMRHGWTRTGLAQLMRAEEMRPDVPYVVLLVGAALAEAGDEGGAFLRVQSARDKAEAIGLCVLQPRIPEPTWVLGAPYRWRNPCTTKIHVLLADFYCARGAWQEAERELLRAISRYPGHAHLMAHLGRVLRARGNHDDARGWLCAATRADCRCNHAHLELGFVLAELGEWDEALSTFQTAVDLRPLFPDYRYHLGMLLLGIGKVDEAAEEFRQALVINPRYGHVAIQLASVLLDKKLPEQTLEVLATDACAGWPETLLLQAEAHLLQGKESEARILLEKLLSLDGYHHEARELLDSLPREAQVGAG